MFNSGILEVMIGLLFVYLILSLICTAVNELIEAGVKARASDLHRGICEMLNENEGKGLVEQLYNHPLIYSLFQDHYDSKKTSNLPSYIPSHNFSLALMDLIMSPQAPASSALVKPHRKTREKLPQKNSAIANDQMEIMRTAVNLLSDSKVRQALLAFLNDSGNDFSKVQKNIEAWFDSTMDRVSGWYKRRVQLVTLLVGFGIAVLVNADTIAIGNSLSYDVSLRDSLVAAAQEYAKADASLPVVENQQSQIAACRDNENSSECRVLKNAQEIQKLGLPMGWNVEDPRTFPVTMPGWITKILGWLLTAFAISIGAPFWFDLLNRIIIIRSTVRPTEKSPEEPAVNPKK